MNAKHKKLAGVLATIAVMAFAAGPSQAEPFKVVGSKARGVAAQQFGPWVVDLTPSAISALGSLLGPQPAPAAGPLSVTQSGTWSMNGTVQIGNPADNPALVRDVRERQAVHVEETKTISLGAAGEPDAIQKVGVVVVPAGVRLVIEQAGAQVRTPITFDLAPLVVNTKSIIDANGDLRRGVSAALNTTLLHPAQPDASVDHFLGLVRRVPFVQTFQTRLYADPGTEVEVVLENFEPTPLTIEAVFSASGYIEACPPGALPITCP